MGRPCAGNRTVRRQNSHLDRNGARGGPEPTRRGKRRETDGSGLGSRSEPPTTLKTGVPSRRRCLSWPAVPYRWRCQEWWRRRESNPRPKAFCNDVYMHIRVVDGNPRPEAPFPLSVPHRINPANRGSEPIPCAHRRLGKTAGKARLGRRPFPPGRRGQEERGYLSSQCQFSVGFCFVSTVYERWTPDMQSLLHIPSSNPVRPPSSRD